MSDHSIYFCFRSLKAEVRIRDSYLKRFFGYLKVFLFVGLGLLSMDIIYTYVLSC